jgi:hypothetical protein
MIGDMIGVRQLLGILIVPLLLQANGSLSITYSTFEVSLEGDASQMDEIYLVLPSTWRVIGR